MKTTIVVQVCKFFGWVAYAHTGHFTGVKHINGYDAAERIVQELMEAGYSLSNVRVLVTYEKED